MALDDDTVISPANAPRPYLPHDRLSWRQLADYLGWTPGTVRKLVAAEAWEFDELPRPAFHRRNSPRTHWLFADVSTWRSGATPGTRS